MLTFRPVSLLFLQVPGQFVGVRPADEVSAQHQHLYTIACSPYESRRDSAYKSGSIIEVSTLQQS